MTVRLTAPAGKVSFGKVSHKGRPIFATVTLDCGPASKTGPSSFRPQVIGMQQLSQIDWGFHSAPISTALSILTLLLNILVQAGGVPLWTPIHRLTLLSTLCHIRLTVPVDAAARRKAGAFTSAGPIDRASHRHL